MLLCSGFLISSDVSIKNIAYLCEPKDSTWLLASLGLILTSVIWARKVSSADRSVFWALCVLIGYLFALVFSAYSGRDGGNGQQCLRAFLAAGGILLFSSFVQPNLLMPVIAGCCALICLRSLVEYICGVGVLQSGSVLRVSGKLVTTSELSFISCVLVPVSLSYCLQGSAVVSRRLFWIAVLIVTGLTLFATLSRGAGLGALGGSLYVTRTYNRWLRLGVLIAAISVVAAIDVVRQPDQVSAKSVAGSDFGRHEQMRGGVRSFQHQPWIGVGVGHVEITQRVMGKHGITLQPSRTTMNAYLFFLVEGGILGVALLYVASRGLGAAIRTMPPKHREYMGGALSALAILSCFDVPFLVLDSDLGTCLLVGLLAVPLAFAAERAKCRSKMHDSSDMTQL